MSKKKHKNTDPADLKGDHNGREASKEANDQTTPQEQETAGKGGKEVSELEEELGQLKDKYLRLYAEFENYKKRTIREKLDMMRVAAADTVTAILPVLDDFDRAKKSADDEESEEYFSEGVELVYHKLYRSLESVGLQPMESDGQPFDPELHEAVTEIPAPSEALKGKVVDTLEKGYKLKDKIIRHAKVVVGK